jgi:hypothetical protein
MAPTADAEYPKCANEGKATHGLGDLSQMYSNVELFSFEQRSTTLLVDEFEYCTVEHFSVSM